jgi:hypothetical protein
MRPAITSRMKKTGDTRRCQRLLATPVPTTTRHAGANDYSPRRCQRLLATRIPSSLRVPDPFSRQCVALTVPNFPCPTRLPRCLGGPTPVDMCTISASDGPDQFGQEGVGAGLLVLGHNRTTDITCIARIFSPSWAIRRGRPSQWSTGAGHPWPVGAQRVAPPPGSCRMALSTAPDPAPYCRQRGTARTGAPVVGRSREGGSWTISRASARPPARRRLVARWVRPRGVAARAARSAALGPSVPRDRRGPRWPRPPRGLGAADRLGSLGGAYRYRARAGKSVSSNSVLG